MQPFENVVAEHGPTVWRVCRALLGAQDAEDAWAETFLSALRAYPRLPADADVAAWLVTIAHRRSIDAARARARRPTPAGAPTDIDAHRTGTAPGPAEPDADDPGVLAALARLPDKQRRAVAYHHLGGLPFAEVAALLDNSPAAARRAAADGLKTLRAAYRKEPNR